MKKYKTFLVLDNERTQIIFETDIAPIEYLWTRYGMDTYIESLQDITGAEMFEEESEVETE